MPITVPLNNASLLVDTASESLNNYNVNYVYENTAETVASLQLNGCKVLREFTYTNIITGNGLFTFNVPEKIPGIFALQLLKCYVDVQPRLQELTETIRVNGQYPLSAFITELDETDGISKDSVINVDVSGDVPVLESKSITINSNGSQNVLPSSGYDGLSSVSLSVNVPVPSIEIGKSERITTNGIIDITPDTGYDALESVRVNVAVPNGTETKSITSNGTYTPTSPNIGFSSVTVNVPEPKIQVNKTLATITTNGDSVVIPSTGYDAMQKVTFSVNVPNGTQTKTITSNGTYTPTSPNIGFSSVTVNVPTKQLETRQVYYSTNGVHRLSPSTGYDGFTYADIEVNVPTIESIMFNKFKLYYYSSSSGSEQEKLLNPMTMNTPSESTVAVQSGHTIFYITQNSNYYEIGFFNNNSGNTYNISLSETSSMYNISTANFISAVSLYNGDVNVLHRVLDTSKVYGSTPYELGYVVKTILPTPLYVYSVI